MLTKERQEPSLPFQASGRGPKQIDDEPARYVEGPKANMTYQTRFPSLLSKNCPDF